MAGGGCGQSRRAVSFSNPAGWGFTVVYDQAVDIHPSPDSACIGS